MIINEKSINGSTVSVPNEEQDRKISKEYRELKRVKKERNKRNKERQWQVKKGTLKIIALLFICGFSVVYSYGNTFTKQKTLLDLKKEVRKVNEANDNLKVELLKFSNFEYVKSSAEQKLGMVAPDRKNALSLDLNKDNFQENEKIEAKDNNMLNFFKDLFF